MKTFDQILNEATDTSELSNDIINKIIKATEYADKPDIAPKVIKKSKYSYEV